ncbi:MAG: glycosyltransferase [Bacteroidales bacterium]|nr:glycosyltransferase [Bacteroidales bacterium]
MAGNKKTIEPLVSCIMPTCNRREFVPQAIRYFLSQDYSNKKLLIVDDGAESVSELIPDHTQIRYLRLSGKQKLGTKRNYCVLESKGDLIMHWDDDDWMAPYRISYQVRELLEKKVEVCGLQQMLFYNLENGYSWLYRYPKNERNWLAGGSLLYTRDFWKQAPFPDVQEASDTRFVWSRKLNSYTSLDDYRFYVAMIHSRNTSPKKTNNSLWKPYPAEEMRILLSRDWDFYSSFHKSGLRQKEYHGRRVFQLNNYKPVSACLLSYKRPNNLQLIIDSIHDYPFIDEILVWNNNPNAKLSLLGEKVRIIESEENMICYGRFLCAKNARNEVIYTQDDDVIVRNVTGLYKHFLNDKSCITHALSRNHFRQHGNYIYPDGQVALLGWGSFFRKEWIEVIDTYLNSYESDFTFKREADIMFSLLLGKRHNTVPAQIEMLPDHSTSGIALYREKKHELFRTLAINRALKSLRKSKSHNKPVTWNVVIPCRNYGKYLEEAVFSVLHNKADYVITIVDDSSTDNTLKISKNLITKYPFIKYIRHNRNVGVSCARNSGIAAVESIFVVLLDADDKISSNYLFEAEKLLRSGCDIANPDAILFGERNTRWVVPEKITIQMLLKQNYVHCAAAFRRSYWLKVGGIDESMSNWQDYDFWIRLAEAGARIRKLTGDHFYYRKHGLTKSSESAEKRQSLRNHIKQKHEQLYTVYHQ